MVKDIQKYIQNVEDVEEKHIISKIRDVHVVDSLIRKLENIIGLRRQFKEKDKAKEEWLILKKLKEELKMDLDIIQFLNPNLENKSNNIYSFNITCFNFYIFYQFFKFILSIIIMGND